MRRGIRRRQTRHAGAGHDRWLITYADLITLLLIFFVVLYAVSRIDIEKYDKLSQALTLQFRDADSVLDEGAGILDGGIDRAEYEDPPLPIPTITEAELRERELQDLLRLIQQYVINKKLEKQVFVDDTSKGVSIRLSDRFLFDLGRADLKTAALPVLDRLSELFAELHTTISIQGHTDNLPVQAGAAFQDNWGLSAGRALSVLRYFVENNHLAEDKFEVTGYADTRPIAANDTEGNRQKNRRVEILVLR